MKRNQLTAMLLLLSCAPMAGCATPIYAQSEQACEIIYADVEQDSTETLRQILQNNKTLEAANNANK